MTASRLVLQSAIVLFACLVGFVMGRYGAPSSSMGSGAVSGNRLSGEPVWDFDASGSLGGSLPATSDRGVDSASGFGSGNDQGPDRQFFPDAVVGDGPGPLAAPESAEPIQGGASVATAGQIKVLIEQELPGASDSDKRIWAEELAGLPLESVREILQLKQALGSLGRPDNRSKADLPDAGRR